MKVDWKKAARYLAECQRDFKVSAEAQDESLQEHDDKFHNPNHEEHGHFDPETMKCGKREGMAKEDEGDIKVAESKQKEPPILHRNGLCDIIQNNQISSQEKISNGSAVHQRIPEEALRGLQAGGCRLGEATDVCRRNESPSDAAPAGIGGEADRLAAIDREHGKLQERDLEEYAKAQGIWQDDLDVVLQDKFGKSFEGGESIVFFDEANQKAHKLITNTYYRQPVEVLDRIALHNWLFPDTAMNVLGFGRSLSDWQGDTENPMFVTEVEQPFVKARRAATESELKEYMNGLGFEEWKGGWWTNKYKSVVVGDLHDENAVVDDHGNVRVIDADIRLNTPALRLGGTYKIPQR